MLAALVWWSPTAATADAATTPKREYTVNAVTGYHDTPSGVSASSSGSCTSGANGLTFQDYTEVIEEATGAATRADTSDCQVTYAKGEDTGTVGSDAVLEIVEEVDPDDPQRLTRATFTGTASARRQVSELETSAHGVIFYAREFLVEEPTRYRISGTMSGTLSPGTRAVVGVALGASAGDTYYEDFEHEVDYVVDVPPGTHRFATHGFAHTDNHTPVEGDEDVTLRIDVKFEPVGPAVAISASPLAISNLRNARFEFAAVTHDPSGVTFQCRVDGVPTEYDSCVSPKEYGGLSDGEHVFEVRALRREDESADEVAGVPSRYEWLVDTIEPTARILSGPAPETREQSAEVRFTGSDGGSGVAGYLCRVDDGEEFACASPERLTGLAPGDHRFEVRAVDAAGNAGVAVKRDWRVTTGPVSAAACPPGSVNRVQFGVVVAIATSVDGCLRRRTVGGDTVMAAAGPVSINGIVFSPQTGSLIVVDGALGSGTVGATGPTNIEIGPLGWPLEKPFRWRNLAGSAAVANKALAGALKDDSTKVFGLKVTGGVKFGLSADDDGTAKIETTLKLEQPLKATPGGRSQSLAFDFALSTSNAKGVDWAFKKITIGQVFLGRLKLKDVELAVDPAGQTFEGAAAIEIPGSTRKFVDRQLKVGLKIGPDGTWGFLHKIGVAVTGIERHLAHGFFLQQLNGAFDRAAGGKAKLSAGGLVSWLPRMEFGPFKGHALSVDGQLSLSFPVTGDGPIEVEASGVGKLVELPVQKVKYGIDSNGKITYEGEVDFSIGGYGILAKIDSTFFDAGHERFNVKARGEYRPAFFDDPFTIEAVVSDTGAAACFTQQGFDVDFGWGKKWGSEYAALGEGDACDLTPYETKASASRADAPARVRVRRGTRALIVSGRSDGAPPELVLEGPGGRRLGPAAVRRRGRLLMHNPADGSTFIALARPAPGHWTVTSGDGRPVNVRFARDVRPLAPRVRVTGRGRTRTLRWRTNKAPDQRLTFTETGKGTARTILTTRRARGRIRFRPDRNGTRARRVHLLAERGGVPREARTVARYTAPAQPRLRRTSRIRLRRDRRTITWRRQRGAAEYVVAVRMPGGTVTSHTTRRARQKLPARLRKRRRVQVTIVAVGRDGRTTKPATRKLRAGSKPRKRSRRPAGRR